MAASRLFIQLAVVAMMAYYGVDGADLLDKVKFSLYTRKNKWDDSVLYYRQRSYVSPHFKTERPLKIIIHGFKSSATTAWVIKMKDELLKKDDVNVLTVDWSQSFGFINYDQGVEYVEKVGAMLSQWLDVESTIHGLSLEKVHIIGHSLGAQMAGYVGDMVGSMKIGRITALDPAKPQFEGQTKNHVVNKRDAKFVDVIHTDAGPYNVVSGYGMSQAVGTIDFYPNGGIKQPGCEDNRGVKLLKKTGWRKGKRTKRSPKSISCNHSRAIHLFIDSINADCTYGSTLCSSFEKFLQGACPPKSVTGFMGYYADTTKASGKHYLVTDADAPFCREPSMHDEDY